MLRSIVLGHAGGTVAVVSHKATIRLLICALLGLDARGYRDRLDQSPACLNVLDFRDPVRARLTLFNDVSHYADRPRHPQAHLSKWWDDEGLNARGTPTGPPGACTRAAAAPTSRLPGRGA